MTSTKIPAARRRTPAAKTAAAKAAPRTMIPNRESAPEGEVRALRSVRLIERFELFGAAASAMAVTTLLFSWFTPLQSDLGWVVVAFLLFLTIYGVLTSLDAGWQEIQDRVVTSLLYSAGFILFGALIFIVAFALLRGQDALVHLNFFTQDLRNAGPLDPLDKGGIVHAILGTLIQISIALAITIPLGITTAVFLNEVGGRFARFVRTISDAMTALPSIVAGLFIYAAVIILITHTRSGFAAALAISVMMLPIIIRASDVVLRLVPRNLREASLALGSSRWQTVWHVVLPTARSGLVTAVILGTARGVGETSPVLLTSGVSSQINLNPFDGPMISLPLQVFTFVRSPEPGFIARGFGTAAVLITLVLILFALARALGGRGAGVLSARQVARAKAQSTSDLARIIRRNALTAASPTAPTADRPTENR